MTLNCTHDTGFFRFADIDYSADSQQIHIREYEGENDQWLTVVEEWFNYREVNLLSNIIGEIFLLLIAKKYNVSFMLNHE